MATGLVGLLLLGTHGAAWAAPRELTSEELDEITGGTVTTQVLDGVLHFQFAGEAGRSLFVDGSGSIALTADTLPNSLGALVIRDNAQSNLSSFVNIAAVNSVIQLLINLNVNINSAVGTVQQLNLSRGF